MEKLRRDIEGLQNTLGERALELEQVISLHFFCKFRHQLKQLSNPEVYMSEISI